MSKELMEIISDALDFGRHPMDDCVVIIDDDCLRLDGWINADDIKRAYRAIVEYEESHEQCNSNT